MESKLGNGGYVPINFFKNVMIMGEQAPALLQTNIDDPSLFWPILCNNTYDTFKIQVI